MSLRHRVATRTATFRPEPRQTIREVGGPRRAESHSLAGKPVNLLGGLLGCSPSSWAEKCGFLLYGNRKDTLLESVPLGVTTSTFPEVAPVGTVVVISEGETSVNTAAMPLKLTLVAPVRSVPRILTAAPTLPEVGGVFTNGPRPTDRLKTFPSLVPPSKVVP